MSDLLSGRLGADRGDVRLLCLDPGQELLIGSVPVPPAIRMGLEHPIHLPIPHLDLPPQSSPAAGG
jgi:hypothetical protein